MTAAETVLDAVREVPTALVTEPGTFLARILEYEHTREIFIDTETAEWWTPAPRVALLQVYDGRQVAVFDTLATGMADVLFNQFVPRVMANGQVRKWAHNASYERRFLGGPRVQNLECTLRLARGIAFHRLPVETLSLASLASTLCGVTLDKTLQNADWSERPLSREHLEYAAADTLWCARVRTALDAIEKTPRADEDDPRLVDAAFPEAKLRELHAGAELKTLREAVRSLMRREGLRRFSRFATWDSERLEVPLGPFVSQLVRVDPAKLLEMEIRVTKEMLEQPGTPEAQLLARCRTVQNLRFHTPRVRRPRGIALSYEAGREDAERVTRDYESRARAERIAASLVDELKQRMRAVLDLRGATTFGDWGVAPGPVTRFIDVRDALECAPGWAGTMVPLTRKYQVAIGEEAVAALAPATSTKSSAVIRWCSRNDVVGLAAPEWRWWSDSAEDDQ